MRLQDLGVDLMVLVADYQTIIDRDSPASLPDDVEGLVADYLAVGIDPARATIFAHSQVEALNQLLLPFLSLVSVAELSRNPTVKDEMAAAGLASMSGLMFTYPVHQAADILFCKATVGPGRARISCPTWSSTRLDRAALQPPLRARAGRSSPSPRRCSATRRCCWAPTARKMSKSRGNAIAAQRDRRRDRAADRLAPGPTPIAASPTTRCAGPRSRTSCCSPRSAAISGPRTSRRRSATPAATRSSACHRGRQRAVPRRSARAGPSWPATRATSARSCATATERAREIAEATLAEVRERMHTDYSAVGAGP